MSVFNISRNDKSTVYDRNHSRIAPENKEREIVKIRQEIDIIDKAIAVDDQLISNNEETINLFGQLIKNNQQKIILLQESRGMLQESRDMLQESMDIQQGLIDLMVKSRDMTIKMIDTLKQAISCVKRLIELKNQPTKGKHLEINGVSEVVMQPKAFTPLQRTPAFINKAIETKLKEYHSSDHEKLRLAAQEITKSFVQRNCFPHNIGFDSLMMELDFSFSKIAHKLYNNYRSTGRGA